FQENPGIANQVILLRERVKFLNDLKSNFTPFFHTTMASTATTSQIDTKTFSAAIDTKEAHATSATASQDANIKKEEAIKEAVKLTNEAMEMLRTPSTLPTDFYMTQIQRKFDQAAGKYLEAGLVKDALLIRSLAAAKVKFTSVHPFHDMARATKLM